MKTVDLSRADIIALDSNDEPLIWINTSAHQNLTEEAIHHAVASLQEANLDIPFIMLIDQKMIRIYRQDVDRLLEPLCKIPTAGVLSFYEPEYEQRPIFDDYLRRLVEGWLRDIAYHWKSHNPPYLRELSAIQLAQRLHQGATADRYRLQDDPLR